MIKILNILIAFQLLLLSFYTFQFFQGDVVYQIVGSNRVIVALNFQNDFTQFERFLEIVTEENIHVSKVLHGQSGIFLRADENLRIYTTDPSMGGRLELLSGSFPANGSLEFISNDDTYDENQVGLINLTLPNMSLIISYFDQFQNFALDGDYHFHTTDPAELDYFFQRLVDEYFLFEVMLTDENTPMMSILTSLVVGTAGFFQILELGMLFFISWLIMFLCSIQYVVSQVKKISILKLHGVSTKDILFFLIKKTSCNFIVTSILVFSVVSLYRFFSSNLEFWIDALIIYSTISIILILVYLVVVSITALVLLRSQQNVNILKGEKKFKSAQFLNHAAKCLFLPFLLISIYLTFNRFRNLNHQLNYLERWQQVERVYTTFESYVPYDTFEMESETELRRRELYIHLSEKQGAFIMDAQNIRRLDSGFSPYINERSEDQLRLSPNGYSVTISPNFLEVNPIETVTNEPIAEQLIWEEHVWNLLVPEALHPYESIIISEYLEEFYWHGVELRNTTYELLGQELSPLTRSDLEINIIYVKDGQYYFSFDSTIRPENGGHILDPIAVVYTGNHSYSALRSWFSMSLYFISSEVNAFEEIFPLIYESDLTSEIRFVGSVYDGYHRGIHDVNEQIRRLGTVSLAFLITSSAITYNLIANYFETNKFKLVVKRHFGYNSLNRNKEFIRAFSIYSTLVILMTSFFLGWAVFFFGSAFLIVDIIMAMLFERHLMSKSFAEIMKGER